MFGVGVRRMVMVVAIPMAVIPMAVGDRNSVRLAGACALSFAQCAALRQTFHVVVMAFLGTPDILFKAEHLGSVFAEGAIHRGIASQHLLHPLHKRVDHLGMVTQIAS